MNQNDALAARTTRSGRQQPEGGRAPFATIRITPGGRLLHVETGVGITFGGEMDPAPGRFLADVVAPEPAARLAGEIDETLRTGRGRRTDYAFEHNGETRHHEVRIIRVEPEEAVLIVTDVTARVHAEAAVRRSRRQLRSLARHVESIREEERKRISNQVHDVLGQALTALRLDLDFVEHMLPEKTEGAAERLRMAMSTVVSIIQSVRRIASDLRPGILDDLGVAPALEWLTEEFASRTGMACTFRAEPHEILLPGDCATALFRVAQDILSNVARHADASVVHVALTERPHGIVLRVEDNGRGIRPQEVESPFSYGLVGIRERLMAWGGRATFVGRPEGGTDVTISLRRTRKDT